jgi:predicted cupin superfamily sugar epimerase
VPPNLDAKERLKPRQLIELLDLRPLPVEGGLFRQTYASSRRVDPEPAQAHARPFSTAIFYLLTGDPGSFSAMHRLPSDEVYHFYLGDPVEMLLLYPDGLSQVLLLGQDLAAGQRVQVVVLAGTWQGSRLTGGGEYALLGTTMAPGYSESDYEAGAPEELERLYPDQRERIRRLTR